MEYPILYKDKRFWKIYITNKKNIALIHIEHGQIGGKITKVSPQIVEPTSSKTALDRAKQLAKTKWQNKITTDGFAKKQETKKQFLPMKPVDWDKYGDKIEYPAYLQPKLDGVRMFALIKDGKLTMLSRQNKPISNITHLEKHLEAIFKKYPNIVLDGELLIGEPYKQSELRGILAKKYLEKENQNKIDKITYNIFDLVEMDKLDEPFNKRWELAEKIAKQYNDIRLVPTYIVQNKSDIKQMFTKMVELGYEGAIIRNFKTLYRLGKQSMDVQKIKLYFMDKFKIIGYDEAKGNDKGTVIWEVQCLKNTNRSFRVKPMGTREMKKRLYENAEKHIGEMLEVYFYEKDEDGCVVRIKTAENISKYY